MDVVKTAARSSTPTGTVPAGGLVAAERRTRTDVIRRLLADGPSTAARLAAGMGVSGTAVRRHLDALAEEGAVASRDATAVGRRGRGRPAKVYLLTDVGRARLPHAYDELATEALEYLAERAGSQAVTDFARRRAQTVVDAVRGELAAADAVTDRTRILANALTQSGYAASVEQVGVGEQLCQHHCPVAHVAARYPQLCEEELAAFTSALGTYAQRLATIARGDSFCTTFIPEVLPEGSGAPDRRLLAGQPPAPESPAHTGHA
jgi:predicted ArsR family transcriptional regulator